MIYKDIKSGVISANDFKINLKELRARLGYEFNITEIEPYIKQITNCATFRYAYLTLPFKIEKSRCFIGESMVETSSLSTILDGCENVIIFAISSGPDVDRTINRGYHKSSAEGFILDAVASAYIESFADFVNEMISKELDTTKRFSPGYSDFSLEFQQALLAYLDAKNTVGIDLTDKLLMVPSKSITAVLGIK